MRLKETSFACGESLQGTRINKTRFTCGKSLGAQSNENSFACRESLRMRPGFPKTKHTQFLQTML